MYIDVATYDKGENLILTQCDETMLNPLPIGEYKCGDIMFAFFINVYNAIIRTNGVFDRVDYNDLSGLSFDDIFSKENTPLRYVFTPFKNVDNTELADCFDLLRESIRVQAMAFKLKKLMDEKTGGFTPINLMPHNLLRVPPILFEKDHEAFDSYDYKNNDNLVVINNVTWVVRPREYSSYFTIDEEFRTHQAYKVRSISELVALDYFLYHTRNNPKGIIGFCDRCGKPFKSERADAMYCSNSCASQFKNKANDDYEKKFRYWRKRTNQVYPTVKGYKDYEVRHQWLKLAKKLLLDIQSGKVEMTPDEYTQKIKELFKELYEKNHISYNQEL